MIAPLVHLNGTSKDTLLEEYGVAVEKVMEAIKSINQITVHGRDYYVQPNNPLSEALEDRRRMVMRLEQILAELGAVYSQIEDQ